MFIRKQASAALRFAQAEARVRAYLVQSGSNPRGQAGRRDEAVRHYMEAIALAPSMETARNNLGNLLVDAKRPAEAAEQYRGALTANPRHAMTTTSPTS